MSDMLAFNADWRFCKGEVAGAEGVDFDDGAWRAVTLPHDWSIEGPFEEAWASATGYLPGGVGWYRISFEAPAEWAGHQVAIVFDGVYCNSEVWINGHSLGVRPNGFVSFRYDLTPYLGFGGRNTIAVRVDHAKFADCRWYTGSGIYRNVHIEVASPVRIRPWGVFATTPDASPERAVVRVDVDLENHTPDATDVCVTTTLAGPDGSVVAEASAPAKVPARGEGGASLHMDVASPRLWSPEHPDLYTLSTTVTRDGETLDAGETRIGIRSIRFDPDDGFTLNGENVKMKGVCLHDDAGALGVAVPPRVWERRLRTLKAAGVNAIRMAHNPHMPELYDLCDALGFLVQDEAFDEWELGKNKWVAGWNVGTPSKDGYSAHFAEWAEDDLRDMVLRDRNHPCIVMWSIGNEIDYPNDPYTHEVLDVGTNPQIFGRGFQPESPHADRLGEVAKKLSAIVKQYDTTRPVTAALSAALISNETSFADALDVVGYNYQEYRYADDHAKYPGRILYGSENGMHWEFWEAVETLPYISGQFLWTGIDYLGEAGKWPARSNTAGLLDLAGFPKPEFFYRQSLWSDAPMVFLGTREVPTGEEQTNLWSHKKAEPAWRGTEGEPVRVVCFTNGDEVELTLNGRSLGTKTRADADRRVLSWDIPYEPGTLRAIARKGGKEAARCELKTAGPPARIAATSDAENLAPGDLAHIEVAIVDADGTPVPDATDEVLWSIEGPARLLGLESGDPTSHEPYQATARHAYKGRQLGYLQRTSPGPLTLTLTAPNLEGTILRF